MSSSAEDVGPSPQTCCATCRTVFEVSAELLGSSDTRVRCGECYRIFDALENLVAPEARRGVDGSGGGGRPPSERSGANGSRAASASRGGGEVAVFPGRGQAANGSRDTAHGEALDVTYSDFDLFSEDADLPDVAYFDRTSETPEFDFDSVELDNDETFDDTLFAHDVTIDAGSVGVSPAADPFSPPPGGGELEVVEPAVPREPLKFVYRDADPVPGEADREAASVAAPLTGSSAASPPSAPSSVPVDASAPGGAARRPGVSPDVVVGSPAPTPDDGAGVFVPNGAGPATGADPGPGTSSGASVPFELDAPVTRRPAWPAAVMALALVALLAGLHLWRVRDAPADDPFVRPAYELACAVIGCEVPARVALDRLTLLRREMYEHAELDDALVIDVAFRNDAPFAQRYPVLVVRLSAPSGQLVARRAFAPEDYLPRDARGDADAPDGTRLAGATAGDTALAAGARLDIRLEVGDPGEDASSFEIDFREP